MSQISQYRLGILEESSPAYFRPYIELPDIPQRLEDGYYNEPDENEELADLLSAQAAARFRDDCIQVIEFLLPGNGAGIFDWYWTLRSDLIGYEPDDYRVFYEDLMRGLAESFGVSLQAYNKIKETE